MKCPRPENTIYRRTTWGHSGESGGGWWSSIWLKKSASPVSDMHVVVQQAIYNSNYYCCIQCRGGAVFCRSHALQTLVLKRLKFEPNSSTALVLWRENHRLYCELWEDQKTGQSLKTGCVRPWCVDNNGVPVKSRHLVHQMRCRRAEEVVKGALRTGQVLWWPLRSIGHVTEIRLESCRRWKAGFGLGEKIPIGEQFIKQRPASWNIWLLRPSSLYYRRHTIFIRPLYT